MAKFEYLTHFRTLAIGAGEKDPFHLIYKDIQVQDRIAEVFESYADRRSIDGVLQMLQFKLLVDRWLQGIKKSGIMMLEARYSKFSLSFKEIIAIFFISKRFGAYSVDRENEMDFREFFDAVVRIAMRLVNYSKKKGDAHHDHVITVSEAREILKFAHHD